MPINGVVEVFVKTSSGCKVGATFEDNDDHVAFVNQIFPEAMMDFINNEGDPINVAQYDIDIIENRINAFENKILNLNGSVAAKLKAILQFVKNNKDIYEGIKVYV